MMAANVRFQAIGELVPANQSPFTGCNSKSTPVCSRKSEQVTQQGTHGEQRKIK